MSKVAQSIHIEPAQKAALQRLAESSGRSVAAEIRQAIDRPLNDERLPDEQELEVLSQEAAVAFAAMCEELDAANAKLTSVLAQIERLRETER